MQELGEDRAVEPLSSLLDESEAKVDVAEELALGCREEERPAVELGVRATVVGVTASRGLTVLEIDFANPPGARITARRGARSFTISGTAAPPTS